MNTLVIAPHPDDETLGVGGTLFRRKADGGKIAWLIVTCMSPELGYSEDQIQEKNTQIKKITKLYGFDSVYELNFPSTTLDQIPMSDLIQSISNIFEIFKPEEVFCPHHSDIHTDHQIVFKAVSSCSKWFRMPFIKRVLSYETPSETEFSLIQANSFTPNFFVDISPYLEDKLNALRIYSQEIQDFPFPRSDDLIRSLAMLRGSNSGFNFAEGFILLMYRG